MEGKNARSKQLTGKKILSRRGSQEMAFKKTAREKATVNSTHDLYMGKLFSFFKEDITLPNGNRTEMAIVRHPGSTGIVPLFDDGTIAMVSQ